MAISTRIYTNFGNNIAVCMSQIRIRHYTTEQGLNKSVTDLSPASQTSFVMLITIIIVIKVNWWRA